MFTCQRRDRASANAIDVALSMLDLVGREMAVRYLLLKALPPQTIARVLADQLHRRAGPGVIDGTPGAAGDQAARDIER